jgi:ATP diphosphatase
MTLTNKSSGDALQKLLAIMDALRDPQHGCPWDLEQDYSTIAPHTLEEVYEVIDAIEQGSTTQLESELGDLLFQIVFYARLGKERGDFDFTTIVESIARKLLQRHPHVFPDGSIESAGQPAQISSSQVAGNWERIKQTERQQNKSVPVSVLDDVPQALGALLRAGKLQKRAASQGFDWAEAKGVIEKLREELAELEQAIASGSHQETSAEFGDVLFTMVNLARHLRLDSETALRKANRKFETRFRAMEKLVMESGKGLPELDIDAMERYWQQVKQRE